MANKSTSGVSSKSGYYPGAIVRVKMSNFMTYSAVEVHLGPRMNVIVGPNGTGKSTILCAICLGLGGKPLLIGRAPAISDYIKHGFDRASIEIELCNVKGRNFIVGREILNNNQSTWSLNGVQSSQKAIDELMNKLNIQMNNLCQFLPQDRVAEFVKMSTEELLENTEKAIGKQQMWEDHAKLKNWHSKAQDLESNLSRVTSDLEKEMQSKGRLEELVNVYHEKRKHLEQIETLNKKKAWVEYDDARQEHSALNKLKDKKASELKQVHDKLNPLRASVSKYQNLVENANVTAKELATKQRQKTLAAEEKVKSIDKLNDSWAEAIQRYRTQKQLEEDRIARISTMKQQLLTLENELSSSVVDDCDLASEMNEVNKELQNSTSEMNKLQGSVESANKQKRMIEGERQSAAAEMNKIKDINQRRMELLRRKHRHAFEATMWLRDNRDKFRKTIHEPIMTVVNVRDPKWAKYVERQIPFKDMIAFVCEDADDLELFMSILRDTQNLKINVVMAPERPSGSFQPRVPISAIQKYGFHNYLREMVDAPDAVLSYLCAQMHFHQIPVGNEQSKTLVPNILRETEFRQFYTADHQYSCSVSRYGNNEKSTRCSQLQPANLLTANLDTHAVGVIEKKLEHCHRQLSSLDAQIKDLLLNEKKLNGIMEELRQKKKDLMTKRDCKKNLMAKIEYKKSRIQSSEEGQIDLDALKQKTNLDLKKINGEKLTLLIKHQELVKACFGLGIKRVCACCNQALAMQEKSKAENDLHEQSSSLTVLEREVQEQKQKVLRMKGVAKQLLEKAKRLSGVSDELISEAMKPLELLPNTLEELESEIHRLQAQVDCLLHTDDSALQNYEQWQAKVENLETELERKKGELLRFQQEMLDVEQRWLPPLLELIEHISSRFSRYFKSLGCAGEVGLSKGENEKDYSKFGMCIKVKFRSSEPLRELTSCYQSGGERSVATILYLLALQEFIKLPFCCVDEINQGMDSVNEQRVLQLMTETLCNENLSQYFLVTPKLLKTSEFGEHVTCHWIFNGTIKGKNWNVAQFIRNRRALRD